MICLLWGIAGAAAAYQLIALLACLRHLLRRDPEATHYPGVSVLKPIRGLDPQLAKAIESHYEQDYPAYEILFGASNPQDPALRALPQVAMLSTSKTPNGKVGVLIDLNACARYPLRVVNDSDITVPRDYLKRIVAPLEDPRVGMVTCLYRADADTWPGRFEALGIATDFVPGVLVAPMFGVNEFAMGSTLAFRGEDLHRIGGFEAIADYIADDYQLGKRISRLGLRVHLSKVVVETRLAGETLGDVWRHQLRWARTIRVSRGAYAGLPVTNATLWAAALWAAGQPAWAAGLLGLRLFVGLFAGALVLRSRLVLWLWWLMPLRDLWGFAVWIAGMFGSRVVWRDQELALDEHGRIVG